MTTDTGIALGLRVRCPAPSEIADVQASSLFDAEWYAGRFPDVARSGLSPAEHYLWVGALMMRDPSPSFSTRYYLTENGDVARAGMNPLLHFIRHGNSEGRRPTVSNGAAPRPVSALAPALGPRPWISTSRESRILGAFADPADPLAKHPPVRALDTADDILNRAGAVQVSVVIPTWNRADVIGRAIRSVLGQSLVPSEILLVDDGSTDDTVVRVCAEFSEAVENGRLRILQGAHRGVSAARNIGLRAVTGDLVAYLDSDNSWRPDYLKLMTAFFAECDDAMTAYCGLAMNDADKGVRRLDGRPFDRHRMVGGNFIDLNVFMHRREIYDQLGGFDETLKRLVDWDLILRYTKLYEPAFLPFVGVDYFLDGDRLQNITRTVPLDDYRAAILGRNRLERCRRGLEDLRIAYVLWDWPALSQSFVIAEIEWLVRQGVDVEVFHHLAPDKAACLDFDVMVHKVEDYAQLAGLLRSRDRTLVHAHFAYPAATRLAWPACRATGIPFTFFAHAVDIFHEDNIRRNRIAEMVADPLCLRLFVHGDYHRRFLETLGVPVEKIGYNFQAVDLDIFRDVPPVYRAPGAPVRGLFVGRFVEKKGIATLIDAASKLKDENVVFDVHGYGPLEEEVRRLAVELGLSSIVFHGPLEGRHAVRAALARTDFTIVPSIVAKNGDTEGFPTIILESLAAGRPVVTTTVSSIPNFLVDGISAVLTEPGNAESLAEGVCRVLAMSDARRDAMLRDGRAFLESTAGTDGTMQTYFDTWTENIVDIVLVTYNTEKDDDREETREIIERLRKHTTTPYTLTVIDNGSDPAFRTMLLDISRDMPQMRLLRLNPNRFCGPATNLALASSDSVFTIYVCSKEGFVLRHGWERPLIDHMRNHPDEAMAGTLCHMPRFTTGAELIGHPDFERFRHPDFAGTAPERPFRHVQGGVYILRRDAVARTGGFSDAVPQGNTDVEFSYFLESRGECLGTVPEISSLTVKTLPRLSAVMDENTAIAHPLTLNDATDFARFQVPGVRRCNLCETWNSLNEIGICEDCSGTPLERKIYQRLAHDWRAHRGGQALLVGSGRSLASRLGERMFEVTRTQDATTTPDGPFALICLNDDPGPEVAVPMAGRLQPKGLLIWPETPGSPTLDALCRTGGGSGRLSHRTSRVLQTDWRRLVEFEKG